LGEDLNHVFSKSRRFAPVYNYFKTRTAIDNLGARILTALAWYNRSTGVDIEESVALVNLAIAFESLLGLKAGEKVTERFMEAVNLLVGDVPRLDSWLTQFYRTRSQIVHEGQSSNLMFIATAMTKNNTPRFDEFCEIVPQGGTPLRDHGP
jgi:hypothetical protein